METTDKFIWWYNDTFKQTELYSDMISNAEFSPWHMEHSIAAHTDMVVMNYLMNATTLPDQSEDKWIYGAFAAAFHDVGKPASRIEKYSEERGTYFAFHGHEKVSARLWEDYAVANWDTLVKQFNFTKEDIFKIGFLIEQHKPWDIKDPKKLEHIGLTLDQYELRVSFSQLLLADTRGRVTDDLPTKVDHTLKWLSDFNHEHIGEHDHPDNGAPTLYVPIGASGSGKTTHFMKVLEHDTNVEVFSMDVIRLRMYKEDYATCYQQSTRDDNFRPTVNKLFIEKVRKGIPIYLDNVNVSRKSRRFFIEEARRHGYRVEALLFPNTVTNLINRQARRKDKTVPPRAVQEQYIKMGLPQIGEVDSIKIVMD